VLELFVAVLQAYVFTILTAIYIQMSLADGH
jgi:F-type H+-transporting ATPase subunit a